MRGSMHHKPTPQCDESDCPLSGWTRRDFLQGTLCVAGALAMAAGSTTDVFALPMTMTSGVQAGNEHSYPIPAADGVTVDRGAQVMLTRTGGRIFAFAIACPHQNAAVKWLDNEHRFQCTRHNSKYQPDGVYSSGRATRNLDRYPIRREGNMVHVDVTRVFQSDKDAAGWQAASVAA